MSKVWHWLVEFEIPILSEHSTNNYCCLYTTIVVFKIQKSFSIFAIKKCLSNFNMKTVTVRMNEQELKRFESFKEAEKIVRGIKRGLREINQAKSGKTQLKSARQLANEI